MSTQCQERTSSTKHFWKVRDAAGMLRSICLFSKTRARRRPFSNDCWGSYWHAGADVYGAVSVEFEVVSLSLLHAAIWLQPLSVERFVARALLRCGILQFAVYILRHRHVRSHTFHTSHQTQKPSCARVLATEARCGKCGCGCDATMAKDCCAYACTPDHIGHYRVCGHYRSKDACFSVE